MMRLHSTTLATWLRLISPTKSVQSNGSLTCHSFMRTYLSVLKSLVTKTCWFDTQIYYTSYFVMVFTHVGTWLWKAMPCRVQGNCPDAWNIYALFVARVVPLHIFLLQYFFAFGPSWSWLLDSGFSKVATDKRVQVILLKLFGKDWKRRFFWSW